MKYQVIICIDTFLNFYFVLQSIVLYTKLLTGLVVKKISLFWLMILEVNSLEAICGVVFTGRVLGWWRASLEGDKDHCCVCVFILPNLLLKKHHSSVGS